MKDSGVSPLLSVISLLVEQIQVLKGMKVLSMQPCEASPMCCRYICLAKRSGQQ